MWWAVLCSTCVRRRRSIPCLFPSARDLEAVTAKLTNVTNTQYLVFSVVFVTNGKGSALKQASSFYGT